MKCLLIVFLSLLSPLSWGDFTMPGDHETLVEKFNVANPDEPTKAIEAIMTRPKSAVEIEWIVLLPGYGLSMRQYQAYADHLASHGFYVASMDFLKNRNAMDGEHPYKVRQVQFLLSEIEKKFSLKIEQYGLLGHSLGAKIGFMLAREDDRLKTVIALDPVNGGGPPCFVSPRTCALYPAAPNPSRGERGFLFELKVSSLIMRSAPDRWLNPEAEFNAQRFFYGSDEHGTHATPAPSIYFDLGGRSHAAYLPSRGGSTVRIVKRTSAAWFDQSLRSGMNWDYFTGNIIQEDVRQGHLLGIDERL